MEINFTIPFLVAATGAILGAFAAQFFGRRKERFRTTIELFRYYHSDDMIIARYNSWNYLKNVYIKNPKSFRALFSDNSDNEHTKQYNSLIRILYFWYMVWVLHKEGEIVANLTKRLLSYQYGHWRDALKTIYDITSSDQEDRPEWLAFLNENQMDWIIED